jgi:hypothetical protein
VPSLTKTGSSCRRTPKNISLKSEDRGDENERIQGKIFPLDTQPYFRHTPASEKQLSIPKENCKNCVTLLTELNQSFIFLLRALEIANVETPTWRATSTN